MLPGGGPPRAILWVMVLIAAQRRDDDEAALIGGFAHDVQRGAEDRGGPVEQAAGERAVGEHEPHPGAQVGLQQGEWNASDRRALPSRSLT